MVDIKVIEIKLLGSNCDPLKAIASVRIGDINIYEWRILKKEGERVSVQPPHAAWKGQDGLIKYRYLLSMPRELKQRIEVAILSTWERKVSDEKGKEGRER